MLYAERRTGSKNDLALESARSQLIPQLLVECGIDVLGEHDDPQRAQAAIPQEPPHAAFRKEQFLNDRRCTIGPSQYQDVIANRDWRQSALEPLHGLVEPLREDGDEGANEDDVAQKRHDSRDRSKKHTFVVAQIAGVAQAQKCPPDGLVQMRELPTERPGDDSAKEGDQHDHAGNKG